MIQNPISTAVAITAVDIDLLFLECKKTLLFTF